ncbi:hypothetical protein D3C78_1314220 [compost metagenome]
MAEQRDVVGLAVAILDLLGQHRLGAEAEFLEGGNRIGLVDRHLHCELFQFEAEGDGEAFLDQPAAETAATPGRRRQHAQLADMARPGQVVDDDGGAAHQLVAMEGDQAVQATLIDGLHPGRDDLRMADVATHE